MSKGHKKSKGIKRTSLSGHTQVGGKLLPPFAKLGNMKNSSWMNDRLPEMLWAALIVAGLGREIAIREVFRPLFQFIEQHKHKEAFHDIRFTGIAKLEPTLRLEIIELISRRSDVKYYLSSLRLFPSLPSKADWDAVSHELDEDSLELLMKAVGLTLFHQSQEATDCRWVKLMPVILTGGIQFPTTFEEKIRCILEYPDRGDQREVRPSIRSLEIMDNPMIKPDLAWPHAFWRECWDLTPCFRFKPTKDSATQSAVISVEKLNSVKSELMAHWENTHQTTAIDAKHDTVFGVVFYSLRVLEELLGSGLRTSVLGRLGLRTLLELRITLHHLIDSDDEELWKAWRVYGAGQAKLSSLKLEDIEHPPEFLSASSLAEIANEDIWEEMLEINLGHWKHSDLRKMARDSGLKSEYDVYYPWTSCYSHGQWGAIRESVFKTCANPLHRFHRHPDTPSPLTDLSSDAVNLVDSMLDDLDKTFPGFSHRLRITQMPPADTSES